jgi:hypothetical protein
MENLMATENRLGRKKQGRRKNDSARLGTDFKRMKTAEAGTARLLIPPQVTALQKQEAVD